MPGSTPVDHHVTYAPNEFTGARATRMGENWEATCNCGWHDWGSEKFSRRAGLKHVRDEFVKANRPTWRITRPRPGR